MFFTLHVLSRKGSLGTVWIAAHLDKKLKRQQISDTDIRQSVDLIMIPEAPFALRLSGQLLFGLARVYKRQVTYLLQDCNDALNKLHHAFVRTTLPEMDATAALKNLTLPEDFFQINEAELSQLYGIFPDIQWIEGDDSLVEACIPQEAFQRDTFALPERGMSYGSDMESRELPPMDEIIPEEELARDVMRERSSVAAPRLSSLGQTVIEEEIGEGPRKSDVFEGILEKSVVSGNAMDLMDDPVEPAPETPGNQISETLPLLPSLEPVSVEALEHQPNAPLSPILEDPEKSAAKPIVKTQKKHKVVLDKKRIILSTSDYRKMHKETVKATTKARRGLDHPSFSFQVLQREALLERSSVKQVALSENFTSVWKSHLHHRDQEVTEQTPVDDALQFDIERNQSELPEQEELSLPPLPFPDDRRQSAAFSEFEMNPVHIPERSPVDFLEKENELLHQEPAGEHETELPSLLQDADAGPEEPQGEFSHVSLLVLSQLKRRFTEQAPPETPQDDLAADDNCPSPKRRRLSQVVRSAKHIGMFDVMQGKSRLEAGRWFYELMVLKSRNLVKLDQPAAYAEIMIHDIKSM